MVENLNASFVNKKYRTHRASILMDREKARLPETMSIVGQRLKAQGLEEKNAKVEEEIKVLREKLRLLWDVQRKNTRQINTILRGGSEEKKQHFHKACPADNCKGFLSTSHKCGICNIWACAKCFEIKGYLKDEPHTCKEENVKTAAMLKKETKNCPGCASAIYKISGCDQMYCTQCHIAFSWKTSEIEKGIIHNPHFYEWQRQAGHTIRNPQEVPCGGIPEFWLFNSKIKKAVINGFCTRKDERRILNFHRQAVHWQHWEIRNLRRQCIELDNNLELRVGYLLDRVTENEMKASLISKEKSKNKKRRILHIYELMNTVFTESLIDIFNSCTSKNFDDNMIRLIKLINYSNKELARISYVYSQTVKLFTYTFNLESRKFNKKQYNKYTCDNKEIEENTKETGETKS